MGIVVLTIGLVIGSFVGALSYRLPREISISRGRSKCPKCGKQISWYDNIPVLSYLFLQGRCRRCKKRIPLRYPIIEIITAFLFLSTYLLIDQIKTNLTWLPPNQLLALLILFVVVSVTMTVLVIDAEQQIIPDELVYMLWSLVLLNMVLNDFTQIYDYLAAGFIGALFLLLIHLITAGKGMGLGDVKLAIVMGTMLGPINTLLWFFVSFILGGVIGSFLLVLNKAKLKDKVAFGPFLIVSFFIVALYGEQLSEFIFPYL